MYYVSPGAVFSPVALSNDNFGVLFMNSSKCHAYVAPKTHREILLF